MPTRLAHAPERSAQRRRRRQRWPAPSIVRRGLPYGPPFDPANPDDSVERGLIGLFIVASLKDQFEFVMQDWVNGDSFAPGLRGTRDPILGNVEGSTATFTITRPGAPPIVISDLCRSSS